MSENSTVVESTEAPVENEVVETEEGSEQGEEKASPPPPPAPPASMKKKFKLKVDGEEVEEEIDLNDEEGLRSKLQLARAAKKRMADAQAEKKKAFEIIKAFDADPESFLERLGPKGREIAEKHLLKKIQDEMLTPEQKELRALKRENETFKQKEEREKKEREEQAAAAKENEYAQTFQKTIIGALDKSGMPKSAANVKRLAFLMSKNLELGLELTPEELAAEWKAERAQELSAEIKDMTAEQFIALYGADMAKKLQQHAIKQLQEKQGAVFQGGKKTENKGAPPPPEKPNRPETMDEWRARIERNIREN